MSSTINLDNLEQNPAPMGAATGNAAQKFMLSKDPGRAMQEMMDTINDLKSVYLEENAALMDSDLRTFLKLQERKVNAAEKYERGITEMKIRKDEMKNVEQEKKERLISLQEEFVELAKINMESLDRMRSSVKRLSDRVMTVARETVQKEQAKYGAAGALETNDRRVSIGLNESA